VPVHQQYRGRAANTTYHARLFIALKPEEASGSRPGGDGAPAQQPRFRGCRRFPELQTSTSAAGCPGQYQYALQSYDIESLPQRRKCATDRKIPGLLDVTTDLTSESATVEIDARRPRSAS
jgi:hypothetical protein